MLQLYKHNSHKIIQAPSIPKAVSIDTNYEFPVVGNIKDNYDLLLLFGTRIKGLNFGGADCEIHIVSTDSKVRGFAERFRLFGFNCDVDDNLVIVHKDTVEPSKSSLIEQCLIIGVNLILVSTIK